jgi:hypothetical protein
MGRGCASKDIKRERGKESLTSKRLELFWFLFRDYNAVDHAENKMR